MRLDYQQNETCKSTKDVGETETLWRRPTYVSNAAAQGVYLAPQMSGPCRIQASRGCCAWLFVVLISFGLPSGHTVPFARSGRSAA